MSTRDRVLELLRGREAQRIRFRFPNGSTPFTISAHSFARVARAIERGRVRVRVVTTFGAGVAAEYHTDTNEIHTPPVLGRTDAGLVLHECTHAFFDLARVSITALDDEAAAYVVDALYFRMTGLARPRWNAVLHAAAGTVADGLLRHYAAGDTPLPTVDNTAWGNLRTAIRAHPVYRSGAAGTGAQYLHNG